MRLHVVRHAAAGSRVGWRGCDPDRPLSGKGRRQAAGIAEMLAAAGIARLVSSPYVRCVQTLEPLAAALSLAVETDGRLAEGAGGEAALELASELGAGGHAVVCSHGDVIPEMLHHLRGNGTRFTQPLLWPKGSTWVLTGNGGRWTRARYVPPPGS